MKQYQHIFFDLDDTLWDFQKNSTETLSHLFEKYRLSEFQIQLKPFLSTFHTINERLWKQYSFGRIDKEFLRTKRFKMIFNELGYEDESTITKFGHDYLKSCPYNSQLVDGTIELLEYLFPKYQLHVITNGFEEIAHIKVQSSRLEKYFKNIFTSEISGAKKPNPRIFQYSFQQSGANNKNSIMIGNDLEADVIGASEVGMDQVYCNFKEEEISFRPTYQISSLSQIMSIL